MRLFLCESSPSLYHCLIPIPIRPLLLLTHIGLTSLQSKSGASLAFHIYVTVEPASEAAMHVCSCLPFLSVKSAVAEKSPSARCSAADEGTDELLRKKRKGRNIPVRAPDETFTHCRAKASGRGQAEKAISQRPLEGPLRVPKVWHAGCKHAPNQPLAFPEGLKDMDALWYVHRFKFGL